MQMARGERLKGDPQVFLKTDKSRSFLMKLNLACEARNLHEPGLLQRKRPKAVCSMPPPACPGGEPLRIAGPSRRRAPTGQLKGGVLVLLVAQGLALLPRSAWHLRVAGSSSPQTARAGMGTRHAGRGVLMRLRGGASEESERVGGGGAAAMEEEEPAEVEVDSDALLDPEKLFEALATCSDKGKLLGRAHAKGDAAIREQERPPCTPPRSRIPASSFVPGYPPSRRR